MSARFHPTQKPVELAKYLVKTYSNKGDVVFDFCMGGGTTGVASVETGRFFIGCEKDSEYYIVAKTRIDGAYHDVESDESSDDV